MSNRERAQTLAKTSVTVTSHNSDRNFGEQAPVTVSNSVRNKRFYMPTQCGPEMVL